VQGIYWIRNIVDGKRYIGSAGNLKEGLKERRRALKRGKHGNIRLQRAWKKHGEGSFVFEIVEVVGGDRDDAYDREQEYLDEWFPTGLLYNIAEVVGRPSGFKGKHHTPESKDKLSVARKKYYETNDVWNKGVPATEEIIQKNRESSLRYFETHAGTMLGKNHTQETREKQRRIRKEWFETHEGTFKGKQHTEESKKKNSESKLRYFETHDAWNKGIPRSEECKVKIRITKAANPYVPTENHRQRCSEAHKGNNHNAKSYPAFYNIQTNEYLPSGKNLVKLCNEYGLFYQRMWELKKGATKTCSSDGWHLATPEEIQQYG